MFSESLTRFLTAIMATVVFLQTGVTTLPVDDAYKTVAVLVFGALAVFLTTLVKGEAPPKDDPPPSKF